MEYADVSDGELRLGGYIAVFWVILISDIIGELPRVTLS